ncbi:MAG TPA: glycosyltransferase, partial [Pyrinomonadaceae bacterium]|nr:glycosyltransferase [Pyrinomonadaceae bacterium]
MSAVTSISVIVPTIGRTSSLSALLDSLAAQTRKVNEIIIADGSSDLEISNLLANPKWQEAGLV